MSVCVSTSSALSRPCPAIDMTMSQMSLGSTAAMMHSIAHQMQHTSVPPPQTLSSSVAPSSLMHPLALVNGLPSSSMNQGLIPQGTPQVPDLNEPNPEMLLALIARNKSLEGKCNNFYGTRADETLQVAQILRLKQIAPWIRMS